MNNDIVFEFMKRMRQKSWERRLFKSVVRKHVNKETYDKISEEYNQAVTQFRRNSKEEVTHGSE